MSDRRGDGTGWRDALSARVALLRATWTLRRREVGGLLSLDPVTPERETSGSETDAAGDPPSGKTTSDGAVDPAGLAEAKRIGHVVRRAADSGFLRPRCLVRALALKRLLDDRGLDGARIRVGVREAEGAIEAHAWVEYRGHVVGDYQEHVGAYEDLRALQVDANDGAGASPGDR